MAQTGLKKGATMRLGRWLVSHGREWLNSKLDPTKSQPLSPGEEAALQDSIIRDLTGKGGGGMTMDEDEFKKFQAFQKARGQPHDQGGGATSSSPDQGAHASSRAPLCNLYDPAELAAVLEGYYAKYNPEKVSAVQRIAAKWAAAPDKLAAALEEKYLDSRLVHFCPSHVGGAATDADAPSAALAAVPLSAWAADPSSYTAALSFIVMVSVLLATRGIPLKDQPAAASRVDAATLGLLALGAANLSASHHGANACVLALGGAQLAWMVARQWHARQRARDCHISIPANMLRRPRRKDWYNY
jgi:hypothetical protein